MIIGLSGYARSGKDSVAEYLVQHHGFTRLAFADNLKQLLYDVNPIILSGGDERVQSFVDYFGWDESKKIPEVRELLQRLGESARERIGQDVWINAVLKEAEGLDRVVISDVRYQNEANAIRFDAGGKLIRIIRYGVSSANDHISETDLDNYSFDASIHNDYTLSSLGHEVERVMEDLDIL